MGLLDCDSRPAATPVVTNVGPRPRPPRFVSEFETEIRQLYMRAIEEPIPARLIEVLRAGLAGHKP
jgi:lipopolysaccharide/colanic/teichoic acid biosynthesis glycosyltransferase